MNPVTMTKYVCPKCGAHQIKQPTSDLIIKVKCVQCGHIQLLTNVLGQK